MSDPRMSADEVAEVVHRPSRLRALAELEANAVSSAEALDRIGRVACRVLGVPVALVNLIGDERQRFVGCGGPEPWASMGEMPLTAGFCPFALGADTAYCLEDARAEPAFAHDPAVEQLGVVAYAGVPLRAVGGEPVGTLCALDFQPRPWTEDDLALLEDLASEVIAELQLLTATRVAARQRRRMRELTALSAALAPAENVDEVLGELGRAVSGLDVRAIWMSVVEDDGTLRTAGATGVPLAAAPTEVPQSGEPDFLATRADVGDRFAGLLEAAPGIGSAAVVPLTAGDEQVGVLGLGFGEEQVLPDPDREYLMALGGLSALAVARGLR